MSVDILKLNKGKYFQRSIQREGNITWSDPPGTQAGSTLPLAARVSSPQAVSTSPQAASVSSPQKVVLLPRQLGPTFPRQAALAPTQGGLQAVQVLNSRQAALLLTQLVLVLPKEVTLLPRQLGLTFP